MSKLKEEKALNNKPCILIKRDRGALLHPKEKEPVMFKVKKERCPECLYSKDKIVSNARRKDLLADIKRNDSHFICHKATIKNEDICCKGFYETETSNLIRISQRLGMVEFVD